MIGFKVFFSNRIKSSDNISRIKRERNARCGKKFWWSQCNVEIIKSKAEQENLERFRSETKREINNQWEKRNKIKIGNVIVIKIKIKHGDY